LLEQPKIEKPHQVIISAAIIFVIIHFAFGLKTSKLHLKKNLSSNMATDLMKKKLQILDKNDLTLTGDEFTDTFLTIHHEYREMAAVALKMLDPLRISLDEKAFGDLKQTLTLMKEKLTLHTKIEEDLLTSIESQAPYLHGSYEVDHTYKLHEFEKLDALLGREISSHLMQELHDFLIGMFVNERVHIIREEHHMVPALREKLSDEQRKTAIERLKESAIGPDVLANTMQKVKQVTKIPIQDLTDAIEAQEAEDKQGIKRKLDADETTEDQVAKKSKLQA
jgi:hypothetical protein